MGPDVIGWCASLVLIATLGKQTYRQWEEGSSHGVSRWLFVGQVTANLGFMVYSFLIRNWVFFVANALLLVTSCTGLVITLMHKRREAREGSSAA